MKMNNVQISALTDKIYTQIVKEIEQQRNLLTEDVNKLNKWKKDNKSYVESLTAAVEGCKKYVKFTDDYYVKNISQIDIEDEIKSKFIKSLKLKSYPSRESIKQDIILETIESTDLETIINKLVEKYSK